MLAAPGMTLRNLGDEVRFRTRGGGRQTLNWGDVSVDVEGAGDNTRMTFARAWPAGPALLGLLGAFRQTNDYKFQRSIFALAPMGAKPAPAP